MAAAWFSAPGGAQDLNTGRISAWVGLDVGFASPDGHPSWTESSAGKLRYSEGSSTLRGFIEARGRLRDTLNLVMAAELGRDRTPRETGLTQAYLAWNPIPSSGVRHRFRIGAFYPHISFEHPNPGWTHRYTLSSSAISTWIAEELRTHGVEWTASAKLPALGSNHRLAISAAAFVNNDPTGSLLAWRGWSLHDRQSTLRDQLPLAPLPLNRPGAIFEDQSPYVAPFREIDDRLGLAATIEYRNGAATIVRAGHYDNRGDPSALEEGQYAWNTRFSHLGVEIPITDRLVLISQWLWGGTAMGPELGGRRAVDVDFESRFGLLAYEMPLGVAALRVDQFKVDDRDLLAADDNNEDGRAITVSYRHDLSGRTSLSLEYLSIRTDRPAFAFNGLSPVETESQFQVRMQFRF